MKAWFKALFARVGDLIIKTIAYKVLAAVIVTVVFVFVALRVAETSPVFALGGFVIVAGMWALTVSYRFAEKLQGFVKKPEDRG